MWANAIVPVRVPKAHIVAVNTQAPRRDLRIAAPLRAIAAVADVMPASAAAAAAVACAHAAAAGVAGGGAAAGVGPPTSGASLTSFFSAPLTVLLASSP